MILSLYALLDFAWVSDLRYRYHSADVNFALGEYWDGGIGNSRLSHHVTTKERIGSQIVVPGRSYNDNDIIIIAEEDTVAGIMVDDVDSSGTTAVIPSSLGSGGGGKERSLIPPSLSYARSSHRLASSSSSRRATRPSIISKSTLAGREQQQTTTTTATTTTSTMAWSLWHAIRAVIGLVFALPVIETGIREVRRRHCIGASTRRTNNYSVMSR